MLNNINTLTTLLITIVCVVFVLIVVLAVIYFASNAKKQKKDTPIKEDEDSSLVEFIPSDANFSDVVMHEVEQHNLKEKINDILEYL